MCRSPHGGTPNAIRGRTAGASGPAQTDPQPAKLDPGPRGAGPGFPYPGDQPLTAEPELAYAERNGLWHLLEQESYPEVLTICGQRLIATPHRLSFEPVPFCWQCRETLRRSA